MVTVTLDWNCIVALEQNNPGAQEIQELVRMHGNGQVTVKLLGINASEKLEDRMYASNFSEFQQRIVDLGLGHLEILKPLALFDMTFFDWCIVSDEEMIALLHKIHGILFPHIEYDFKRFCSKHGPDLTSKEIATWRNKRCDAVALWTHIYHGGDIFITSDTNFHKETKKPKLIALGAGDILTPQEAVQELASLGKSE